MTLLSDDMLGTARNQGTKACEDNKPFSSNPFTNAALQLAWREGYISKHKELNPNLYPDKVTKSDHYP